MPASFSKGNLPFESLIHIFDIRLPALKIKCLFGHFRKFVKTVGYDEFVEITKYIGGNYNEIII